jgi:cobalt-zinc-cadmium efflux system outer membrane protein
MRANLTAIPRDTHSCRRATLVDVNCRDLTILLAALSFALLAVHPPAQAQVPAGSDPHPAHAAAASAELQSVDAIVAFALRVSPTIRAAAARVDALHRKVDIAGAPPDPSLMVGIQNLPISRDPAMAGPDEMTMRMVGVQQTIPYPGKLGIRRRVAEREADVSRASYDVSIRQITRDVKDAYYELAFVDQAIAIVERNRDVLSGFTRVTESRYSLGLAGQQDVLKAHVGATRLAETAVTLAEQRHSALARLNALLNRASDTPVEHPVIPAAVLRAAVPVSSDEIRFTSAALGARAANSPFPPLADLQALAIETSPEIREHEAMIAAQAANVELTRKEVMPDFDLSLQYGQRVGRPDMITALVSVAIPVFKGRKQDQLVAESNAQLTVLHAEHDVKVNQMRAEVARLVSELERSRAQLALYVKALLPQARASLASATSSYQANKGEFRDLLDNQATVFSYETEYFRALSDFAKNLAELERVVGKEIIP